MTPDFLTHRFHQFLTPLHCCVRKGRIRSFKRAEDLLVAGIDLAAHCTDTTCIDNVRDTEGYLAGFNTRDSWSRPSALWKQTASIMFLESYNRLLVTLLLSPKAPTATTIGTSVRLKEAVFERVILAPISMLMLEASWISVSQNSFEPAATLPKSTRLLRHDVGPAILP
jgi:hypothetical protein